jgi:hypothetical protein
MKNGSNPIEKDAETLYYFFEHLSDLKWKTSKLDLVKGYNFNIKIIFIRDYMKKKYIIFLSCATSASQRWADCHVAGLPRPVWFCRAAMYGAAKRVSFKKKLRRVRFENSVKKC